jgi:hypothetical protein
MKTEKVTWIISVGFALMLIASLFSNSANAQLTFTADAINGKVVDEETGAPLDGVIIVAKWTIEASYVGYNNELLNTLETVSDKDGNYGFPAWGPKMLPITAISFSRSDLFGSGNDPCVVYFKSGYWPAREKNDVTYPGLNIADRKTPLGGFIANGKIIKLKKWDGADEEKYYSRVSSVVGELKGGWKKYPRMTLTMDRIFQVLVQREKRKEIHPFFPAPHIVFIETLSAEDQAYLKGFSE